MPRHRDTTKFRDNVFQNELRGRRFYFNQVHVSGYASRAPAGDVVTKVGAARAAEVVTGMRGCGGKGRQEKNASKCRACGCARWWGGAGLDKQRVGGRSTGSLT
jgi:hypothetical protein